MILDCILTATNTKANYIEFVPIFIKTWKKLYPNADVRIVVVAPEIPEFIKEYSEYLILFKPIKGVGTPFTGQYIRLLYPCLLNYKNGILITDMDMLPMNRSYYTKNIESYSNDKFIQYRQGVCGKEQLAMCYNVATPQVWKDIFNINSVEDIIERLKLSGRRHGWCTDQVSLYKYVMEWNNKTKNLIQLKDRQAGFKRLGRRHTSGPFEKIYKAISSGTYTDYHSLRPYSKYKTKIDLIYDLL